ncbi:MAG: acetoin utilization protein AcuC [Promethearchaeota archaeon]
MSSDIALIYSSDFAKYNFGRSHPLKPVRVELTWALMEAYGLTTHEKVRVLPPRLATDRELAWVHSEGYVEAVKRFSKAGSAGNSWHEGMAYGLGPGDNPIFSGMYEAAALVAGASLVAIEAMLDESNGVTYAFNPAGGLHHAQRSRASGFCIFNDAALAIKRYLLEHPDGRVMYVDVDAHHGDGVQWLFYDDPHVLTLSIHESGEFLFPGTGFVEEVGEGDGVGTSINLPLLPLFYEEPYLDVFDAIVPEAAKIYQPDLLVTQLGVDTHFGDPLTSLGLSTGTHHRLGERLHKIATEHAKDNWLALGGGGYLMTVVPRSWTMILAEMLGVALSNQLPEQWVERAAKAVPDEETPTTLRDYNTLVEDRLIRDPSYALKRQSYGDELVAKVRDQVFPLLEKAVERLDARKG